MAECACKNPDKQPIPHEQLDDIIAKYQGDPSAIIPILQDIQEALGYIPKDSIPYFADKLGVSAAKIYGIVTFYAQFRMTPRGKHSIMVCEGTACHVNGAKLLSNTITDELGIRGGETTEDGLFTLEIVACVGCCSLAPVIVMDEETHANMTPEKVRKVLSNAGTTVRTKAIRSEVVSKKQAETVIKVGLSTCGIAAGGYKTYDALHKELEKDGLDVSLQRTGCIGMCYIEPIVEVITGDGRSFYYGGVTPEKAQRIVQEHLKDGLPPQDMLLEAEKNNVFARQVRVALRNCGVIDPESLDDYRATGGYKAIEKAVKEMTPEQVIQEMQDSGLRGRGGAGFPTGLKWRFTRQYQSDQKYIVCNADEGDPGAFMDRSIIEGDPHAVVEGMMVAAYAIGASEGYVYVRAEYPLAILRLEKAIAAARQAGLLGRNIFGTNFSLNMKIKKGAGAFVCGEETALIASLEGERGMPRLKPPFPAEEGLWKKPTCINNVETLANVPWIIYNGAASYAAYGTEKSKGTKVFALAGKINRGGLIEVPIGIPLRDVIYEVGGGIPGGRKFKGVQMGGPSGGCIPASLLDTPVDYESITRTGAIMGSGGMIVMDETTCMVDMARFFLSFAQNESCGKCIHCRLGTKRMLEILIRITEGKARMEELDLLQELADNVKEGALCGLGNTAPNPVLTTLKYFRDEYVAHIRDHRCPAKVCRELLTYTIDPETCIGCMRCAKRCAVAAITGEKKQVHIIDQEKCIKCGNCLHACRVDAVLVD